MSGFTIAHLVAPGPVGGLESVVCALALGQHAAGHRVRVLSVVDEPAGGYAFHQALTAGGVEVHELELPGRAYLKEYRDVTRRLDQLGAQIVHSHGYRSDVVGGIAARRLGRPSVSTVHGFTGGDWKNRLYEWLQCRALRRTDAVVAVSRPLVARLTAAGVPPSRLHLIANAWSARAAQVDRTAARHGLGLPLDGYIIGWVGRLGHEKGPDVMLEALGRLRDLPVTLSMVGEGRERARLAAKVGELALGERIRWHGTVAEAGRFYAAFDCFVLSSRTEGTPIVLFEAMAAGVPVVATQVGGVPDVVGEEGALLAPSDDPAALAGHIRRLYADPALGARLAAAARRRLTEDHAERPWLGRYEALYQALLSSPGSGRP